MKLKVKMNFVQISINILGTFAVQVCIMPSFIWRLNWGLAAIFGRKALLDQNLYAVKAEPLVEYQPCSVRVKNKGKVEIFLTLAEEDVTSICDQDDWNRRLLFKGVFPLGEILSISDHLADFTRKCRSAHSACMKYGSALRPPLCGEALAFKFK